MDLGDVSVKNFGNDTDYLIKFEISDNKNVIEEIKTNLDKSFGNTFDFRRVENVGPKVSAELLKSGIIAICVALTLMLIYIWIRFEWQFSLGAILALLNGYLQDAMTLSINSKIPKHTAIGIGMWLGIIMAFNVWFVIWPNQKKALGIIECDVETKKKSSKLAVIFSRVNTILSLPMLFTMISAQNLY